jgi:hypothetical protein
MASQNLLVTLVDTRLERKPLSQSSRTLRTIAFVIAWVVALYATAILTLWLAWDTFSWWSFWVIMGIALLMFPYILLINLARLGRLRPPSLSHSLLREILVQADDRLISAISIQPVPTNLSSPEEQLGPLESLPIQLGASFQESNVLIAVAVVTPMVVLLTSILPIVDLPSPSPLLAIFPIGAVCALILNITTLTIRVRHTARRRLLVTVNMSGITWRFGAKGQERHMDWYQARAFLRITAVSSSSSSSTMTNYVLIGSDAVLIWSVSANPRAQTFSDSERLLSLIAAQTNLPLCDATQFYGTLSKAGKSTMRLLDYYELTKRVSPDLLLDLQSPRVPLMSRQQIAGIVAAVAFSILPFVAGAWAQLYSSSYFGSLSQRIAAEQPLYSTSLAFEDGSWPNSTGIGVFLHGAYEIHNTANTQQQMALLTGHTFGNAAYSVTATESGAVPDGADDGIGLAFHVSADESEYVTFDVKYDGGWELWHYSPRLSDGIELLDDGTSDAVHQGPEATNTLMIVTYDHSALLFINGHFIEQYQPQDYNHIDLSQTGSVGVFLNSAAMTGVFTNFVVSPAPPADFWDVLRTAPPWHK